MERSKICRLCTQKGGKHKDALHKKQCKVLLLIQRIFGIQITTADESHHICARCDEILSQFHQFYEEILEAQTYFDSRNEIKTPEPFIEVSEVKDELIDIPIKVEVNEKIHISEEDSTQDLYEPTTADDLLLEDIKSDQDESELEQGINASGSAKQKIKRIDRDKAINSFYDFTCPDCSHKASNWQTFRYHLIQKHSSTRSPVIKCCDLELPLDRKQLLGHVDYHNNPDKLRCKWCGRQFVNVDSKRVHEWRHKALHDRGGKKDPNRRKPCKECGKILADKSSFKKHMQLHLSNEEKEKLKAQCDLCKRHFRDKAAIFIHIKEMHLPQEKSFSCDQCAKVFPNCRTFNIHYKTHHSGENKVICPDCGVEMKAVSLRRHKRLKHDTVPQTCPTCFKEFKNRTSLMLHQGRVHVEPKFDCDLCGRMFKEKSKYKEHRESHFNMNRFSCDQCDYINNDYANMLKHRKTKHVDAPPLIPGSGRKVLQVR